MKKNSKSKTSTVTYDHPGRPRHTLKWPKSKQFTFGNIMDANGCDTRPGKNYGKALDKKGCTMLTIRKNMEVDMYFHKPGQPLTAKNRTRVNPRSQVCLIEGVTAEPDSESGLGRRALLFCLRVNKDSIVKPSVKTPKATKAPRKTRTPASTSQTPTADVLDKIHADLAAPVPALTVPAVTITPEVTPAPAPEVTPAPVAETPAPAPVATESANAETATPVAAPVSTLANS